jgi:uncharacterized protein (TIGR02271 family)
MGIPEEEAKYYEGEVRGGRTLVTVRAGTRMQEAEEILHQFGAYDVEHRDAATAGTGSYAVSMGMAGQPASGYSGTWTTVSPYYRDRWQERYGTAGGRWEEYEPAYRYGWEMRQRPEYRDRSFQESEPAMRTDWQASHGALPWDRARDAIRDSWDRDERPRQTASGDGSERTMRLREEELMARKNTVEKGEVAVRKETVTENRTIEVPVTREEVVVDRRPIDRKPADRPIGEGGEEIVVPVREEQVTVEKQPVVTEEVTVGTRPVTSTQRVSGTIRREEARVERQGDGDTRGWNNVRDNFRQTYEQRFGASGSRWGDAEPAYRYGYEYRQDPRFRGRGWNDVEPEVRRDWEGRYHDRPWDSVKSNVREAWEYATP